MTFICQYDDKIMHPVVKPGWDKLPRDTPDWFFPIVMHSVEAEYAALSTKPTPPSSDVIRSEVDEWLQTYNAPRPATLDDRVLDRWREVWQTKASAPSVIEEAEAMQVPLSTLSTALSRLVRRGEMVRLRRGVYVPKPQ